MIHKFRSSNQTSAMRKPLILLILTLLLGIPGYTQLSEAQFQKIDSLFLSWNRPNHPGGVVGIRKGGENVFLRAYGLASMEYLIPNQTSTIFNLASVSKQFTAMGILLLEKEGKLSVDDKISDYIPNLTAIGDRITIRHMLHHTSGIRSFHELLYYAGWRGSDYRTNHDIYRLMEQQEHLNFEPGAEYMYCNTGYIYMALIIEKLSGERFPEWMEKNVFEPLGLYNTYVEDNPARVVPQNATSYFRNADDGFERALDYWAYVGSGNMHATVEDLLSWGENFYQPKPGWEDLFERLQTTDPFNDGRMNNYAFGVNVNQVRGMKTVAHGGSIGGFRSNLVSIPEEETVIVILTNHSTANPGGKASNIFNILYDVADETSTAKTDEANPVVLSVDELKSFENHFWNPRDKYVRKIYLKNDTLMYWRGENSESKLLPVGKNEFTMLGYPDRNFRLVFSKARDKTKLKLSDRDGSTWKFDSFVPVYGTVEELKSYVGKYYSPELEVYYEFRWKDEKLVCFHQRHGHYDATRVKKDVLDTGEFIAEFQRDTKGRITSVNFSSGRVRNLKLYKVK